MNAGDRSHFKGKQVYFRDGAAESQLILVAPAGAPDPDWLLQAWAVNPVSHWSDRERRRVLGDSAGQGCWSQAAAAAANSQAAAIWLQAVAGSCRLLQNLQGRQPMPGSLDSELSTFEVSQTAQTDGQLHSRKIRVCYYC